MRRRTDIDRLHEEIQELIDELWQVPRFAGGRRGFRPQVDCVRSDDPLFEFRWQIRLLTCSLFGDHVSVKSDPAIGVDLAVDALDFDVEARERVEAGLEHPEIIDHRL